MEGVVHTKVRNKNSYADIICETNKRSKDRSKVVDSKGKKVDPRKYHLSEEDAKTLKEQQRKTGKFANPYRRDGVYYNFIQALINLGENKSHRFIDVKNEMKRIMDQKTNKNGENLWIKFRDKKPSKKSELSQWDVNTRIENTAKILQRLGGYHPYGYKLKQLNACIDLLPGTDSLLKNKFNIRLNTSFSCPADVKPVKPASSRKKK